MKKLRHIDILLIGLVALLLIVPVALAEEEQAASVEFLELVAVGSVTIASVLSFMVAMKVGGEMGNGFKILAVSVTCVGVLREILSLVNQEFLSEIFEIVGGIGLLVGFFLLYRAVK